MDRTIPRERLVLDFVCQTFEDGRSRDFRGTSYVDPECTTQPGSRRKSIAIQCIGWNRGSGKQLTHGPQCFDRLPVANGVFCHRKGEAGGAFSGHCSSRRAATNFLLLLVEGQLGKHGVGLRMGANLQQVPGSQLCTTHPR
jgi:hypothetical protein